MKLLKKLLSYIIAVTMVLSLATLLGGNVHAADTAKPYLLTINNTKVGHKYAVYKVFGGDLKVDGETKTLSNIVWGNGVNSSALLTELRGDSQFNKLNDKNETYNVFAGATEAKDVAKILSDNYAGNDSTGAKAFAQDIGDNLGTATTTVDSVAGSTTVPLTDPGYYFVKDNSAVAGHDAKTRFIVQVVGPASVNVKSSVPTVEKKLKDKDDYTGEESEWQDSADADFNDNVKYKITGTMPSNIGSYKSYQYIFTDTMSKGLTYKASDNNVKNYEIYFYANKADADKDAKNKGVNITASFEDNGEGVSVTNSSDAKYNGGKKFTWTCSDLKSIKSLKDEEGNSKLTENSAIVVYYEAKLNDQSNIGSAGNPNKVDLTYSNNPNKGGEGETGKTPEDKNIVFTYQLNVNKYKDAVGDSNKTDKAQFQLFKEMKDGTVKLITITADSDTLLYSAKGLDDGTYILQETKAPDGYNKIDGNVTFAGTTYENAREFTVEATHSNSTDTLDPELTSLTGTKKTGEITLESVKDNSNKPTGTLTTDVIDKKGSTLPSTGGMGTTLLYVAGGILVACAAAYVVLNKKRA